MTSSALLPLQVAHYDQNRLLSFDPLKRKGGRKVQPIENIKFTYDPILKSVILDNLSKSLRKLDPVEGGRRSEPPGYELDLDEALLHMIMQVILAENRDTLFEFFVIELVRALLSNMEMELDAATEPLVESDVLANCVKRSTMQVLAGVLIEQQKLREFVIPCIQTLVYAAFVLKCLQLRETFFVEKMLILDNDQGPPIGIDLGLSNSCVGVCQNSCVQIIHNDMGNRLTPCYVSFGCTKLIGDAAKSQSDTNPQNTVYNMQRIIGKNFYELQTHEVDALPFRVVSGRRDETLVAVTYKGEKVKFTPEEISSMVLAKLKQSAEYFFGNTVTKAVVTVPVYFNKSQRTSTKVAGLKARLFIKLLDEPTAAAIAYNLDKKKDDVVTNALVFNMGSCGFDVTILSIKDQHIHVKSFSMDLQFGGEDLVKALRDYLVIRFGMLHGIDVSLNSQALLKVSEACQIRVFSSRPEILIFVDGLFQGIDFCTTISLAKFEQLNEDSFSKVRLLVKKSLVDANVESKEIDHIVLVGRSTQIPGIYRLLKDSFSNANVCDTIDLEEVIAYGAAMDAERFIRENENFEETNGKTALPLGIKTAGGIMKVVIPRNATLPCEEVIVVSNYITNFPSPCVLIEVYEGARTMVQDNNKLGQIELPGISAPFSSDRNIRKIEIHFEIDENGILTVSAENEQKCLETSTGRLTVDQIQSRVKEADLFKYEDVMYRWSVESKNALQCYIYTLRNKVNGEIIGTELGVNREKIKNALEDATLWLQENQLVGNAQAIIFEEKLLDLKNICSSTIAKCIAEDEDATILDEGGGIFI